MIYSPVSYSKQNYWKGAQIVVNYYMFVLGYLEIWFCF